MLVLLRREIAAFFNALIAYLVIIVFLTGVGLFFWLFQDNVLETRLAEMTALFEFGPWFLIVLAPAITMRAFAEEFKTGTYEWLATRPLTDWQIIFGKYGAAVVLVLIALLPTLLYYGSLAYLATGPLDHGAIIGAYLGLLGVGMIFCAIGLFSSVLSDNQIAAFVVAMFLSFFLFAGFDFMAYLPGITAINDVVIQLGINEHYRSISRGVVDSRDVIYFFSVIGFFLVLTRGALLAKKR